jgi:adenylate cyclase, class 2
MEIEAKILNIDPRKIINILTQIGAVRIFDGEIYTLFYDTPAGAISKRKDLLRLRRIGKEVILTYKRYVSNKNVKMREEYETEVGNLEEMDLILRSLGFQATEKMRKKRVSFKAENARVDIDVHLENYSFIPPLLEIEAKDEEAITKLAEELGFSSEDLSTWDFFEVARHYLDKTPK